jgi:hypothetical protein
MDRAVGLAPRFRNGGLLERARLCLIVGLVALVGCQRGNEAPGFAIPGDAGSRILVEVLNASGKPGLARAGTRLLRRAGIDVVNFGNAPSETIDSTRILVRRGSVAAGEQVRRVLKVGKVVLRPDSTKLLDVSVLLGTDFSPRLDLHP